MKFARLALVLALLGGPICPAQEDPRALLNRVAEVYRSMGSSVMLWAQEWKGLCIPTSIWGCTGSSDAEPLLNRLILDEESVRTDIWGTAKDRERSRFTRIWTRGKVTLAMNTSSRKIWAERPAEDPVTAGAREALETKRFMLFERIRNLPEMALVVTSTGRGEVRIAGRKIACLRVKLKLDPETAKKHLGPPGINPWIYFYGPRPRPPVSMRMATQWSWSAELWVESVTGLVWRANWSSYNEDGVPLNERINYQEIVTGPAVPRQELDFTPPPGMSMTEDFFNRILPR